MNITSDCTEWSILRGRGLRDSVLVGAALALSLSLCALPAQALGLGQLQARSDLGEPFRASIPFFGSGADSVQNACVKAKILALDGSQLAVARVSVNQAAQGSMLALSTASGIKEPAVTIAVNIQCDQPMHREYQVLLNPPGLALDDQRPLKTAKMVEVERNTRVAEEKPASPAVQNVPAPTRPAARAAQAKDAPQRALRQTRQAPRSDRNVLKLSSSDYSAQELAELNTLALRLSTSLSLPDIEGAAGNAGAPTSPEPVANQGQTADLDAHLQAMMKKIGALESETHQLKQLLARDQLALQASREQESATHGWLAALAIFCLTCLALLAWFAHRMHQLHRNHRTHWDEWYAFNAGETEAIMDSVSTEPDREPRGKDPDAALRSTEKLQSHAAATSPAEQEDPVKSSNIIDWPAGSPNAAASAGKKGSAEKFTDEEGGHFHRRPTGLETKEVLDVMQQAEFWVSLQNSSAAIEILEFHVHNSPDYDKSSLPWLFLFDLYRKHDHQEKFAQLQDSFAKTFDEAVPFWKEGPENQSSQEKLSLP